MSGDLTLTLPDGARIVVPDDLRISSSYVLQEQQDWFEDEIRFLRVALQPGLRAIDAGANFGVYTLSLAQRAGTGGRVWAIEPGEQAANYLERSVAANGYTHVDVVRCALSAADGSGFLQTGITPELRRLVRDDSSAAVGVRSLDSLAAERGIDRVDFMKIDVEGEECNVLEGAAGFLESESAAADDRVLGRPEIQRGDFRAAAAPRLCHVPARPGHQRARACFTNRKSPMRTS